MPPVRGGLRTKTWRMHPLEVLADPFDDDPDT
jgi:hypothetical protein